MANAAESRPPRHMGTERMEFQFDELRATQAAAVLLKLAGGRHNYTALLKLLYLADRESLAAVGAPIAGASFANLPNGPLASDVYDCIKGRVSYSTWGEHVRTDGFDAVMCRDPGDGELSDFDVQTLEGLFARHGRKNHSEMIDLVHGLPEWKDPSGTSVPLPPEDIMRAAGVGNDIIRGSAERNAHVAGVASLLQRR